MKLIKKQNGAIVKEEINGSLTSLSKFAILEIVSDNEILVKQGQGQFDSIFLENLEIEIEPAAAYNFAGDIDALFYLLIDEFFIDIAPVLGGVTIGNWKFITEISDLPPAVGGVHTLDGDWTYVFAPASGTLDLGGNRIEMAGKATFLGGSSETTYITSTGLGAGVPLVTTDYTLAIQFLSFSDVDTGLAIDGQINAPVALDWTGVNFQNVPNAFHINYCDNFVYTKGAFLNSKGARFSGTHGTIAFNNCLLAGDGLSGNIIELDNTVQIIRRFRIIYSSVIVFGSTDGIYIDALATIPNQQFILDTVSFSGSSQIQYLPTINYTSNISLFLNCTGIINSADISQYYMNNNATATVIGSIGVPVKAAGTTLSASVTQKFTNTDNRATYVGALSKYFTVTATLSLTSGNNNQIGIYIARNGTILPESEIYITTNGAGRAEAAVVQSFVLLSYTDYVEIWVENETAATNITVTELNVMIA